MEILLPTNFKKKILRLTIPRKNQGLKNVVETQKEIYFIEIPFIKRWFYTLDKGLQFPKAIIVKNSYYKTIISLEYCTSGILGF